MSEKQDPLMTKKEKKKQEKKNAKAYVKAQYNYRVGYIFKTIRQFLRRNLLDFIKKYQKVILAILGIISLLLIVIGIKNLVNGHEKVDDISKYQSANEKLETKNKMLQADNKKDNDKIEKASVSTQTGVQRAKDTIDKVFKGMYNYNDSKEYRDNRKSNMKLFSNPKDKKIANIYSDDKDDDGSSLINNLGLKSELNNVDIYTKSVDDTSKKVVSFKTIVSYTGYMEDVSSDYATRTHDTIYQIDVDTSNNKIKNIKKLNTIEENNNID